MLILINTPSLIRKGFLTLVQACELSQNDSCVLHIGQMQECVTLEGLPASQLFPLGSDGNLVLSSSKVSDLINLGRISSGRADLITSFHARDVLMEPGIQELLMAGKLTIKGVLSMISSEKNCVVVSYCDKHLEKIWNFLTKKD